MRRKQSRADQIDGPYYLLSRDLKKVEGQELTLRIQKNSQDSVKVTDEEAIPTAYRRFEARIDGVLWETVLSLLPEDLSKTLERCVHEAKPDSELQLQDRKKCREPTSNAGPISGSPNNPLIATS